MGHTIIYPAIRAVEHAVTRSGAHPVRIFPVLWPLWQVEVTADLYEEQAYEVIDRYLIRAIADGGLTTAGELSTFFGLDRSLVERCLHFLAIMGHVSTTGDGIVRLTDLGIRSHREGVRYALRRESRRKLLFERFTGQPLPRSHYDGSVSILDIPTVSKEMLADGTRFRPMFALTPFTGKLITDLAARPDRAAYNVPVQLTEVRDVRPQEAYLPTYLIETIKGTLLAYTAANRERDSFLEGVLNQVPEARARVEAESRLDERSLWREWLADSGYGHGTLVRAAHGGWRVVLPARIYGSGGKIPLSRVGSFQLRKNHFLQLWCQDERLRVRAAHERALGMARQREVRTRWDLEQRLTDLAAQLDIEIPTIASLRTYAQQNGLRDRLAHLDALE
ncbi:hypothetical protein Aple_040200 [Acrocarpospora pleiomorpha]|uniref:Uncharacterized protein n=1 Tax=Acrocarpospora pleiomorpha TaxID=90975 RepID=A0A5M3XIR7_9ACTN|nr:hypothetical protein [Acrocarpospora pleiomorpha]GES21124.1 hypothetical protein Aple_040200 [Acrocarpospora pleiomorpha]